DFSAESRTALQYAKALARTFGASITLLHVVQPLTCTADFGYGQVCRSSPNQDLLKKSKSHLNAIARANQLAQGDLKTAVRSGSVDVEIVKAARELGSDLIVMATHRQSAPDNNIGSVAENVVHCAPCAVFVIGKKAGAARALIKQKR